MNQYDNDTVNNALDEMNEYRESTTPLAAILLIDSYTQSELENIIHKLPIDIIKKVDIRFHLIYQLLQNQKSKLDTLSDTKVKSQSSEKYDEKFCDLNEVLSILKRARGTVEALITERKINFVQDKPKGKRRFIREEIVMYAEKTLMNNPDLKVKAVRGKWDKFKKK